MIRTSSIFPKGFFTEEPTRRTPKEQGSKGFNSSISYIILGITEVLASTSQRAKQEKLFNLILIIGSQPSSSFLGMEGSTVSFSSLAVMRALVICSVKARLSVLVWGSLDILCRKPLTSGRVQLSKSRLRYKFHFYKIDFYRLRWKIRRLVSLFTTREDLFRRSLFVIFICGIMVVQTGIL